MSDSRRVLITGGSGFIGSNLVRLILRERDWQVTNLDLLTYAANPANLADVEREHGEDGSGRYRFVQGDIADRELVDGVYGEGDFDLVIHCAAESHVDRSIHDSGAFLRTNVEGTVVLLEAARAHGVRRHLQVGTDEVYGTLAPDDPPFTEATPLSPRSPYSASKAAADQMALAFHHTHGLDMVVTRCSNNYGPYQHPEKLIPLMVTSALRRRPLPVYGDGRQRRDWIHVDDHCRGILAALEGGRAGGVYNFGGDAERENIEVIHQVLSLTEADESLIEYVTDRPGHDRRYAMAFEKAERELGWRPARTFEEGLAETVEWYRSHEGWWAEGADASYERSQEMIQGWGNRQEPADPAGASDPAAQATGRD